MKIKYLGTAAYEGVPSPFCKCRVCEQSRKLGGRNMRSRSQALINGELLMDFNADTVWHFHKYGFDWENIGDCLITHSHCDHLYADDAEIASKPYSNEHRTLNFYAPEEGYGLLKPICENSQGGSSVIKISAGQRFKTTTGYNVLAMDADHDANLHCLIYSVERDGKRLLYAHDTGYFPEHVWEQLKNEGYFGLISLDCTGCLGLSGQWRKNHMTFGTNLEIIGRMKKEGIIDENTKVVINHFSHNGGQTYDEMAQQTKEYGVIISYDGMEVEF